MGMTKSKRTLRGRLNQHVAKIQLRQKHHAERNAMPLSDVCGYWWVFAAEFALMVHYKPELEREWVWQQNARNRWSGNGSDQPMGRSFPTEDLTSRSQSFPLRHTIQKQ
jgi:hypothetical protein